MLVAAQINFEEVGELVHSQARRVQKRLGEDWTALQAAPQIRVTFTPTGPIQETRAAYRLTSSDSFCSLTLNPDSVTLNRESTVGGREWRINWLLWLALSRKCLIHRSACDLGCDTSIRFRYQRVNTRGMG